MKTKHIVIGLLALAAVVGVIIVVRKRKKAEQIDSTSVGSTTSTTETTGAATSTSSSASTGYKIYAHLKDNSKGKHIITVKTDESSNLKVGDKVKITGASKISGTFPIWYIYKGATGYSNLYLDVAFSDGASGGTFQKA